MTSRVTEARIKRTIAAWTACGLVVGSVSVTSEGTIIIEAPRDSEDNKGQSAPGPKSWSD